MTPEDRQKALSESIAAMNVDLRGYRATLALNREVFLIAQRDFVKVFSAADENFGELFEVLGMTRDAEAKSHVAFIPFVALLQRQCRVAFEAIAAFQSYLAWLLLRPGIEALLIMGKWIDDPGFAEIWKARHQDWKAYSKAYSGPALQSRSLPNSDRFQSVLSKVNDEFVHANPEYYNRHLDVSPDGRGYVDLRVECFDESVVHEVHMLAFLHLLLLSQQALADLLSQVFGKPIALKTAPSIFELEFGDRVKGVSLASADAAKILREFGCVDLCGDLGRDLNRAVEDAKDEVRRSSAAR
jgi:hypothetical protein